ncbi:unnamed protein product [Camellia sinensis]
MEMTNLYAASVGKLEKIISKFNISKGILVEEVPCVCYLYFDEHRFGIGMGSSAPFLWPWVPVIDLNIRTGRFVPENRTTDSDIDRYSGGNEIRSRSV